MRGRVPPVWGASGGPAGDGPPTAFTGPVGSHGGPLRSRGSNRGLIITLLISVGLHLAGGAALLLLRHPTAYPLEAPEKLAEVELVMEEHKGDVTPRDPARCRTQCRARA